MTPRVIHERIRVAAQHDADHPAVVDGERTLTYGELDRESNRLAHFLVERGVGPGDRVGLFLEKSIEAVVAIYATLKAGGVYVPLDDQGPALRLAYIARNAGMRCLVSSRARAREAGRLVDDGAALGTILLAGVDDADSARGSEALAAAGGDGRPETTVFAWGALAAFPDTALGLPADPDAPAYILYTSGSTGEPKGVVLSHDNGLAFVEWAAGEVGVGPGDRLSSHAPFHFDLSTFDLFAAAWAGATVVLVPREASIFPAELARTIRESAITVWYSVPSILTMLALRGGLDEAPLDSLRAVIFAGEVFPTKHLARLMALVPQARYFNFYGPTETNVCTSYEVPTDEPLPDALPIGRPIAGVTAIVERADGTVADVGEVGELLIGGPTVMHGYWSDPDRTAAVLSSRGAERTYRTGDLVRQDAVGEIAFIGRRDAQVKTRGYRVELGEIETALLALDIVVDAAAVAIPDETITNRLRAYVVTTRPVGAAELAGMCGDRLPGYMIPDEFEFRSELPRLSTGKIDRSALRG